MIKVTISKKDLARILRGHELALGEFNFGSLSESSDESKYIEKLIEEVKEKQKNGTIHISLYHGRESARIDRELRESVGLE